MTALIFVCFYIFKPTKQLKFLMGLNLTAPSCSPRDSTSKAISTRMTWSDPLILQDAKFQDYNFHFINFILISAVITTTGRNKIHVWFCVCAPAKRILPKHEENNLLDSKERSDFLTLKYSCKTLDDLCCLLTLDRLAEGAKLPLTLLSMTEFILSISSIFICSFSRHVRGFKITPSTMPYFNGSKRKSQRALHVIN